VWKQPQRAWVWPQRAWIEKLNGKLMGPLRSCSDAMPKPWLRDLAGAWIFYSVLPRWPGVAPRFERIARFAPLVGLVLGGLQALVWQLGRGHLPPMALVCLVLALGLALSGGLHLDGLMDTADGLAAGPRALEAMDDSRVGAAAVQALALVLLLRTAALLVLAPAAGWALVWAAYWGRVAPLLAMGLFPYLRPNGTAGFHRQHWQGLALELAPALLAGSILLAAAAVQNGPAPALIGLAGLVPVLVVPVWLGRRLGGHSGDSYGACVEWVETWVLLLMAGLHWLAG
jgi:adenosylcobinamide-GDP ribazoletransferase